MGKIHRAGTEILLDRCDVPDEIERELGKHINYLKTLSDWGVQFLKRSLQREGATIPSVVLFPVLYRQALSFLDSVHVQLTAGAVRASIPSLRALYEAKLSIEWIVENGKEHWARQYYVADLRQRRSWSAKLVPGTPEHEKASNTATGLFAEALQDSDKQRKARKAVENVEQHLDRNPELKQISETFEEFKAEKGMDHEPRWHQPGGGPQSIADMAGRLGHIKHHQILYRKWSEVAHGSRTRNHIQVPRQGQRLVVEPIRTVEGIDEVFDLTKIFGEQATRILLQEYAEDEWPRFARKVTNEWSDEREMPPVEVEEKLIYTF